MTTSAISYSPIFFLIQEHLTEVNLPLRMKVHGLVTESTKILQSDYSNLRTSIDSLIPELFDIRIEGLKWLLEKDGDIDFKEMYDEIYEDLSTLANNSRYGLLVENCLFALRSNYRVLNSVVSQLGNIELENGFNKLTQAEVTYSQLIGGLKLSIPYSRELQNLTHWINSSLRIEFVVFTLAIIQDSKPKIDNKMIEELSSMVVEESHEYYALAKALGIIREKGRNGDNKETSPEFIKEQKELSELGLEDFMKSIDQVVDFSEGHIVNVNLGEPPTSIKGHEQAFIRPCVVLRHFERLKLIVIVPCTTKTPPNAYFSIVKLLAGTGGLKSDSFVLCHQIRTVSTDRVKSVIGQLPDKEFFKIQSVQADVLGI